MSSQDLQVTLATVDVKVYHKKETAQVWFACKACKEETLAVKKKKPHQGKTKVCQTIPRQRPGLLEQCALDR